MIIKGDDIGKKFGKNWIFRNQNFEIESGKPTAITGKNGAGKSTLLQIIAGFLTPSNGTITIDGKSIDDANYSSVLIGPYTEIVEEFTLKEFLSFHSKFKKPTISIDEMANSASLPLEKVIKDFSTGMKQRSKLLTAFFFHNDVILMDEPTSNLDDEGFDWWKSQIDNVKNKTLIISSNEKNEIAQCANKINL
ncbi:ATP-binding cassette domain-containing protein [Ekhidna sp.]|uniref:ABC transporter ATP-binding protein n=1 Tax=Ekhidna sp. TaxID=2608089 RepID=UPI003517FAB3